MTDDDDMTPPTKDYRTLGIVLALVAAACLGYASFTRHWLANASDYESVGIGLRSNFDCEGLGAVKQCRDLSNSALIDALKEAGDPDQSSAFVPCGWITFVLCLITAVGLVAAAGLAIARKTPVLPMTPSSLALLGIMLALISGCVFVATKPGPAGSVGVGISFWVFGAGAVLGIAGAQLLARVNRPADPDLMHDAMNPDEF
jgi:hypothetical protein